MICLFFVLLICTFPWQKYVFKFDRESVSSTSLSRIDRKYIMDRGEIVYPKKHFYIAKMMRLNQGFIH